MMSRKLTKKSKIVIYSIVLFLFIYNPPIIPHLSFTYIAVITGLILALKYNKVLFKFLINIKKYGGLKYLFTFYGFYFLTAILNSVESGRIIEIISGFFRNIILEVCLFLVTFLIIFIAKQNCFKFGEMIQCFIYAGMLQAMFSLLCFIFPAFHELCNRLMIQHVKSEELASLMYMVSGYRNYGLASSIFDMFGFATSIIALFAFNKAFQGSFPNFIFGLFISFSAIINARTSIILISCGIISLLFLNISLRIEKKKIIFIIIFLLFMVIFILGSTIYFAQIQKNRENISWIISGIDEIRMFVFEHKNVGYFSALSNFVFFPENLFHIVFGTGLLPSQKINRNSDVGYIQGIWLYGIIGSIFLFSFFIILFKKLRKSDDENIKKIAISIEICFWLYEIKLTATGYSQASIVFMPVLLYGMFDDIKRCIYIE